MNKKFYTYEEILLALRDEYLDNQELLTKLKRYIYIENGNFVDSYCFRPQFQRKNNEYSMSYPATEKKLTLEVLERLSFLRRTYEEMFGSPIDRTVRYHVQSQSDETFDLKEQVRGNLVWFDPQITITDHKTFDDLTKKILNSDFMNLQSERFYPMFGYRLNVMPEQLYLGNSENWLRYDANNDRIDIGNIKNSARVINLMRETVPECYLNERVKALVDTNYQDGKQIEIDEESFGRSASLKIIDTDKGIKLKKLKK